MSTLKDKNNAIIEKNKENISKLEEFYVNGTISDISNQLDILKEQKIQEIINYTKEHTTTIRDYKGEDIGTKPDVNPVIISNYFFKSFSPLGNKIPIYNAEKLSLIFDYYLFLITEVNDKIGYFPSSLTTFCKLAGITTNTLREYRNSADIDMRNIVEKIYDQVGDDNLTMAQLGIVKEKTTAFKMKAVNEMVEKSNPNINISYKQVINTDKLNENLEKYKNLLEKQEKGDN